MDTKKQKPPLDRKKALDQVKAVLNRFEKDKAFNSKAFVEGAFRKLKDLTNSVSELDKNILSGMRELINQINASLPSKGFPAIAVGSSNARVLENVLTAYSNIIKSFNDGLISSCNNVRQSLAYIFEEKAKSNIKIKNFNEDEVTFSVEYLKHSYKDKANIKKVLSSQQPVIWSNDTIWEQKWQSLAVQKMVKYEFTFTREEFDAIGFMKPAEVTKILQEKMENQLQTTFSKIAKTTCIELGPKSHVNKLNGSASLKGGSKGVIEVY